MNETSKNIKSTRGALDRSFPPVWIIAIVIFVIVILTIISGWKIFNLEQERHHLVQLRYQIETDRQLLGRDLAAHSEILKQLPTLENRHNDFSAKILSLEGQIRAANLTYEGLQASITTSEELLSRAKTQKRLDETAASTARKELASLESNISASRNQSANLELSVKTLTQREKALSENANELKNTLSTLSAEIKGLDIEKDRKKTLLDQISIETGEIQKFSFRFTSIADNLEKTQKTADEVILGLKTQSGTFSATLEGVKTQNKILSEESEKLKSENLILSKSNEVIKRASSGISNASSQLKETTDKFEKNLAETVIFREEFFAITRQVTQNLDNQVLEIGSIIKTIQSTSKLVEGQVNRLIGSITSFDLNVDSFQEKIKGVSQISDTYSNSASETKNKINTLSNANDTLEKEIETLKNLTATAREQLDGQNGLLGKILIEVYAKIENISNSINFINKEIELIEHRGIQVEGDRQ